MQRLADVLVLLLMSAFASWVLIMASTQPWWSER
jgi:hypothetical protein